LVVRFVIQMNSHNPETVPDALDWSPSVLAGRCVEARCVREPEIVIPVVGEFIESTCESEDPRIRETSLRCLRAVFGATRESAGGLFLTAVEMVAGSLGDEYAAVRLAAMDCLRVMVRQYPDACEAVSGAIPLLLDVARDDTQTAIAAFAEIDSISKMPNFAEFAPL
jgi:hypothetical protein